MYCLNWILYICGLTCADMKPSRAQMNVIGGGQNGWLPGYNGYGQALEDSVSLTFN